MTDDQNQPDQDQAYRNAERAAHAGAAALLEKVGDRVGLHAGAKAVFGEPIKEGGRTVVPVAQVIFGMGAGGGGSVEEGTGEGAGGGTLSRPLGYIEITADGAAFVPLTRPWANPPLVLAYSLLALVVLRSVVRLVRS
jgi:hypothetical protein